ncbi:MAG: hypothetical protein Kow0080_10040 [Candidatus Promineifilaceae bacterium]
MSTSSRFWLSHLFSSKKNLILLIGTIFTAIAVITHYKNVRVMLIPGKCPPSLNKNTGQTIIRESDQTTWCLLGVTEPIIRWQWSPDNSHFAYAIQDKHNPSRQLSGRWGYINVESLNWFVMNTSGFSAKRFTIADPHYFTFSPDGEYAIISRYADYGRNKYDVVEISNERIICRYERFNLWYYKGEPPCDDISLKNGERWDIKAETNREACEFHVSSWGWNDYLIENGCVEALQGTGLAYPEVQR